MYVWMKVSKPLIALATRIATPMRIIDSSDTLPLSNIEATSFMAVPNNQGSVRYAAVAPTILVRAPASRHLWRKTIERILVRIFIHL